MTYLTQVLEVEVQARAACRAARRLKEAGFPSVKTFLLDQLEVALQTEQQTTSRLLDALIAETLSESPDPETVETKTQLALSD